MNVLVFIIIFFLFVIPFGIFLRFLDLGLEKRHAFHLVFLFPFEISRIHYNIYRNLKHKNKRMALKALFLPIFDLPQVIVSYAEMHINMRAKILAIKELLLELDDKDIRKMTKQLKKQGFKIKKKKIKKVNVHFEDELDDNDSLNKYLGNLGLGTTAIS